MKALNGVSLSVEKGEFVAVVGTSGSGNPLCCICWAAWIGRIPERVYVDGKDIFSLKEEALTIFRRRKIGFVFQAYNLVPVLSVYENVVLPVELDGKKADREFVQEILTRWGSGKRRETFRGSCPAASSSGRLSRGPWRRNRPFFCAMSPREIWTAVPPRTFWAC